MTTAKERIGELNDALRNVAAIGRTEHETGTEAEEVMLLKLAKLGCAMGLVFLEYAQSLESDEATVSE